MSQGLYVWFLAARPKTLTAALVPILVGTSLVMAMGTNGPWWISLCALLSATFIQVGTNFFNDAIDFKKGADTETRLGPRRATQSGWVSAQRVMVMGGVCFSLALVLGIPLVISGGWVILAIGLVSLLMGYAYTGGPYPLAYRGLGDIFVIIFFGWVAVGGMVYLHCHTYTWHAWVAGTQVGCLATVLIAINNLRDHKGDRDVGKLTLAVRFGAGFARFEIGCLLLVPIFLSLYWYGQGFWFAAGLPLMLVPLVVKILVGVWRNSPGLVYNSFLAQAALLHLLFGIFLAIGFLLS